MDQFLSWVIFGGSDFNTAIGGVIFVAIAMLCYGIYSFIKKASKSN